MKVLIETITSRRGYKNFVDEAELDNFVLPQVCQAAKLRDLQLELFQISSAFAGVIYPSLECK